MVFEYFRVLETSSAVDDPVGQKDFARALGIGFGQIVNQRDTTCTRVSRGVLLSK